MRTEPPNTFTKGQEVVVTYGYREGAHGVVAAITDGWLYQVRLADRSTAWYGSDELEAV